MENDNIFRFILVLGFAVVFPVGAYHRLKAHLASREKLDRRAEGLFILTTLRPVAVVGMVALLAYMINPAWMSWASVGVPIWIRWLGVGLGVMGAALFIVVFRNLGTNLTDTVVTRTRHTLVTTGPYRWVRHPFYVAFALAVAANSIVTANWFLALTGVVTVALIVARTKTEEEKLVERFGDEYRNYMKRTGRFIPRLGRLLLFITFVAAFITTGCKPTQRSTVAETPRALLLADCRSGSLGLDCLVLADRLES